MAIQTVTDNGQVYEVTLANGMVQWVPKDTKNIDYVSVQAWAAGGGTIAVSTDAP